LLVQWPSGHWTYELSVNLKTTRTTYLEVKNGVDNARQYFVSVGNQVSMYVNGYGTEYDKNRT